jgi:5-methylcytosine-specific restriction endonuclease McrA
MVLKFTKPPYDAYLSSSTWSARAREAKVRAGWRCQLCNAPPPVEAHHRTYTHLGREHEHPGDVIVLCEECHSTFHDRVGLYGRWKKAA